MIDMAGLAQKGGAVFTHLRIAGTPDDIHAIRVSAGQADLILGCDLVVSGSRKVLAAVREGHTTFVANTAEIMPGDFTRAADYSLPTERLKRAIRNAAGDDHTHFFDATRTAAGLFGSSIGANMFMLGFAFQKGALPLSAEAIERAIDLNGEAVTMNIAALRWGRRAAHQPDFVQKIAFSAMPGLSSSVTQTLDEVILRRAEFLTAYQDASYARRYLDRIERIREAESRTVPESTQLTDAVVRNLFKLMAVKDEYEVARLYTDGVFRRQLAQEFESYDKLEFHLAPPILGRRDAQGKPLKSRFSGRMMIAFKLLAPLKRLRGTVFDLFSYTAERRLERDLLTRYESDLDRIIKVLEPSRLEAAAGLASLPKLIRGYGHVKKASIARADAEREILLATLNRPETERLIRAAE